MMPRVARNDWSSVTVPELGRWRPRLTVSVVIPAYQCQPSLDLTLAALTRQTYPPELLEVVVVDDGSEPPLELPKLRPERCRLVRPGRGWGRANALRTGAEASDGDVLHWLDADMVVYPSHVEAQVRWQHVLPYAVTLGWKRFVDVAPGDPAWPTPEQVADGPERLFAGLPSQAHDYVERTAARTDLLRTAEHLAFLVHVGATAALRRDLYRAAGGLNPQLRLGEDTEFGYRLAQAGAVFVPEPTAESWHLGVTHMMRWQRELQRYNWPFFADLMPQPRWLRRMGGSAWAVPLVVAVVPVEGQPMERVRAAVDALLRGDETDLRVELVGPWASLTDQRMRPLADPQLDLRLLAATYRSDPRVRLVEQPPESAFPSPYLLRAPATCALGRHAVRRLVEHADRERLGLVRAGPVELWRTAAVSRAQLVRRDGEPLAQAVTELHGAGTLPADAIGVRDLAGFSIAELATGPVIVDSRRGLPISVEVAGLRSLAHATSLVTRLAARRLRSRIGRLLRR